LDTPGLKLLQEQEKFREKCKSFVHFTKTYRGGRCIAVLFLSFGARWQWVVNFTPCQFYLQERKTYLLDRRVSGSQRRCGSFEEEEEISFPFRDSKPESPRPHSTDLTD
jgi:hypothetical protein